MGKAKKIFSGELLELMKKRAADNEKSVETLVQKPARQSDAPKSHRDEAEIRRRALAAVGIFHSNLNDVSVNHDKYLAEDFAK